MKIVLCVVLCVAIVNGMALLEHESDDEMEAIVEIRNGILNNVDDIGKHPRKGMHECSEFEEGCRLFTDLAVLNNEPLHLICNVKSDGNRLSSVVFHIGSMDKSDEVTTHQFVQRIRDVLDLGNVPIIMISVSLAISDVADEWSERVRGEPRIGYAEHSMDTFEAFILPQ